MTCSTKEQNGKISEDEIGESDYPYKTRKKIQRAKVKARSEIDLNSWSKNEYYKQDWYIDPKVDKIHRISYQGTTREEFIQNYESKNIPVVIKGLIDLWPAKIHWNEPYLNKVYGEQKFKVGEDDNGDTVYLKMKHFFKYNQYEAPKDDSPLYIFDSNFSKNPYFKQEVDEDKKNAQMMTAKVNLLKDFFIPKFFDIDLFELTGSRRPPHRWLVIGNARSGTNIHIDPLGSSAWNALIKGYKRWVLFPPNTSKYIIDPPLGKKDREAISWFAKVFPKFKLPARVSSNLTQEQFLDPILDPTLGKYLKMQQVLQRPGETIFVPGGWAHVVMNVDSTIAVTQNFCSPTNLEYVYLKSRFSRPKFTLKLVDGLEKLANLKYKDIPPPFNLHKPEFYYNLAKNIRELQTIPALFTSSSEGSSSSSESEEEEEILHVLKKRK